MKPLARILGILSLLCAVAAVAVPGVGAILLLRAGSPAVIDRAAVLGLVVAAVGLVFGVIGYLVGRRVGATAVPIIGGLSSLLVGVGFAIAPLFV
ncbi:hypothetical protein [Microbacterium sp. B19]|uniref:hypothetical protein n=1 Tax=Microbacterium sp. B19 TaxID=96765 RepID=UPI0003451259|nr:hypothetical protein [Microbacterium sp. B19]